MNNIEQRVFMKLIDDTIKNKNGSNNFELLYRATRDGWTSKDFTNKCLKKKNIVVLIHTDNNNVFGGYISIQWKRISGWCVDPKSFLLLIRSSKKYASNVFKIRHRLYTYGVHQNDKRYIFIIGGFHIRVMSGCNNSWDSFTDSAPKRHKYFGSDMNLYDIPTPYYLNGDVKQFKVLQIEAYFISNYNN